LDAAPLISDRIAWTSCSARGEPRLGREFLQRRSAGRLRVAHQIVAQVANQALLHVEARIFLLRHLVDHFHRPLQATGRNVVHHRLERSPELLAVQPPAIEGHRVRWHEGGRSGVLGLGPDQPEQALATGFRGAQQEVHRIALGRVTSR
jgi:hypothetical protein